MKCVNCHLHWVMHHFCEFFLSTRIIPFWFIGSQILRISSIEKDKKNLVLNYPRRYSTSIFRHYVRAVETYAVQSLCLGKLIVITSLWSERLFSAIVHVPNDLFFRYFIVFWKRKSLTSCGTGFMKYSLVQSLGREVYRVWWFQLHPKHRCMLHVLFYSFRCIFRS